MSRSTRQDEMAVLGRGMYRLSDVARYTELNERRVRSWFTVRKDRKGPPVFVADYKTSDGSHVVSFLDLIDAWVAGQLRAEGVSMPTIRAAYIALRHDLGTEHPFAHGSLYTDGRRVFSDAAATVGNRVLSDVVSKQSFFPRVKQYLTPIEYSASSRLAERWNLSSGIVIDPSRGFGHPVVQGTGVSSYVVAASYWANHKNAEFVADLFSISPTDVGNAVRFEDRYGHQRAA